MVEQPYYIPLHTVTVFKQRIDSDLTTREVRDLILNQLQSKNIYDYQRYNHELQPVYRGEHNDKEFLIPVINDKKKTNNVWQVVPTILLPNMKIYNKDYQKLTATELAIELNIDRSTVIKYLNENKIKALKHIDGTHWKIHNIELKRLKKENIFKKSYSKWQKPYNETEIHILLNNKGESNSYVASLINRNENSVKIKRCRMRKLGYNV